MSADDVFARYSIDMDLDSAGIELLRNAILSPESKALHDILQTASTTGGRRYHLTDDFKEKWQIGRDADEAGFRSEALERLVLCETFSDRLGGLSDVGKPIWLLRDVCKNVANTYTPLQVDRSNWPAIERLIRARVHATETIGAANSLNSIGKFFDPVPLLADAPEPDGALRARLAFQLDRLETAEQLTREAGQRRAFFKPQIVDKPWDVELLAALARASGRTSKTHARMLVDQDKVREERARLVERQSPVWRDLFDALFTLKPADAGKGRGDTHEQAVLDLPEFRKLATSSPNVRGLALAEASAIYVYLEQLRAGKVGLSSDAPIKDGLGEIAHPYFYLGPMVGMLLEAGPVECDDEAMATLIDRASDWRPLCHPHLLDSAERTLKAGPATATVSALRRLAERPSHCYVPSQRGGDNEGDGWWQDTPGRIATMLADRPVPPRRGFFGRGIFGRRSG